MVKRFCQFTFIFITNSLWYVFYDSDNIIFSQFLVPDSWSLWPVFFVRFVRSLPAKSTRQSWLMHKASFCFDASLNRSHKACNYYIRLGRIQSIHCLIHFCLWDFLYWRILMEPQTKTKVTVSKLQTKESNFCTTHKREASIKRTCLRVMKIWPKPL
jgi:hypothetical protein